MCFSFLGIDQGWDIAKIDDNVEYNFINQAHVSDYYQTNYFIGGRTNMENNNRNRLTQKFGFSDNGILLV